MKCLKQREERKKRVRERDRENIFLKQYKAVFFNLHQVKEPLKNINN